ncbi:MAG: GNAT family N-acetyltransferase [Solirubrobacterales bacterium]
MRARAELIEDRGEAALAADFFRSRPFLDAEGATHTLRIEVDAAAAPAGRGAGERPDRWELVAPLLVRPIPGSGERDAISPYGYPGIVPAGERGGAVEPAEPLDPARIDWSATGLVSVFVRHRLGPSPLAGATERNVVQIADPALPRKSRPSDRRQVRRNEEAGYRLALVPGAETTAAQRAGFRDVYEQTMRRTGAAPHYFFAPAYFDRVLEADRIWLLLATAPGGELAAASIAAASDGYLHYYLSGTADSRLREAPMKSVVTRLAEHAAELDLPLNLGGGIRPGDALEEFKRGFANRTETWLTSELICDEEKYERLSASKPTGPFFPRYRA